MRIINSTLVRLISKGIRKISCEVKFAINLSTKYIAVSNLIDWTAIQKPIKTLKCLQIRCVFLKATNLKTVSCIMQFFKTNELKDTFILNGSFWWCQNELSIKNSLKN